MDLSQWEAWNLRYVCKSIHMSPTRLNSDLFLVERSRNGVVPSGYDGEITGIDACCSMADLFSLKQVRKCKSSGRIRVGSYHTPHVALGAVDWTLSKANPFRQHLDKLIEQGKPVSGSIQIGRIRWTEFVWDLATRWTKLNSVLLVLYNKKFQGNLAGWGKIRLESEISSD